MADRRFSPDYAESKEISKIKVSGAITDSDQLTTKSYVDSKTGSNTGQVASNTAQIALNTPQIAANKSGVSTATAKANTNAAEIATNGSTMNAHIADRSNPHVVNAHQVPYDPAASGLTANDLQDAIDVIAAFNNSGMAVYSVTVTPTTGNPVTDINNMNLSGYPTSVGTALRIESHHVVTFHDGTQAYLWVGPKNVTVGLTGNHTVVAADLQEVGSNDHRAMTHRDAADAHPHSSMSHRDAADAHPRASITDVEKVFTDRLLGMDTDGAYAEVVGVNIDAINYNSEYFIANSTNTGTFPISVNSGYLQTRRINSKFKHQEYRSDSDSRVWTRTASAGVFGDWVGEGVWVPVTVLDNGWLNQGGNGSDSSLRYRKSADALVVITGVITSGTPGAGSFVFTLPVGYRPAHYLTFSAWSDNGANTRIYIQPAGHVIVYHSTSPADATAATSLSGISFIAEQ